MLALLLASALAQEATSPAGLRLDEVVAVDTTTTDTYVFAISACDRVKAVFRDERPPEAERTPKVVLTVQNRSGSMCLYRGVALLGFLEGTYKSSLRNPDGTGFFVPPGGEISFLVKPTVPTQDRAAVELQIPPGSGTMVFHGYGAAEVPERPVAPAP